MTETGNPYADAGFVDASRYRYEVLDRLAKQPATPSTIATEALDNYDAITHVSRALSEMRERGLVELLVPEERTKGRVYGITEDGLDAIEKARTLQ